MRLPIPYKNLNATCNYRRILPLILKLSGMKCTARILIFLAGSAFPCVAQGILTIGGHLGTGGSVLPLHARIDSGGSVDKAYAGTTLTTGALISYMISERIGIESGLNVIHYSYYDPTSNFWRKRVWKGSAAIEIFDLQVPILLLHRLQFASNPFRDVTLATGTSLDWLSSAFLISKVKQPWLKTIHTCIRIGHETMKGRRLEIGLEFHFSANRFLVVESNYRQPDDKLYSRLSLLAVNFHYSFYRIAIP
jgi:hypothetical protein